LLNKLAGSFYIGKNKITKNFIKKDYIVPLYKEGKRGILNNA